MPSRIPCHVTESHVQRHVGRGVFSPRSGRAIASVGVFRNAVLPGMNLASERSSQPVFLAFIRPYPYLGEAKPCPSWRCLPYFDCQMASIKLFCSLQLSSMQNFQS
eukprot:6210244-Pleurochrysis_carterae.AAC.2